MEFFLCFLQELNKALMKSINMTQLISMSKEVKKKFLH